MARAADVATVVGAALALVATGIVTRAADTAWQSPRFLAGAAGTVLLGAALPRIALLAIWRILHSRTHENWR
jgi:hypothetical protein